MTATQTVTTIAARILPASRAGRAAWLAILIGIGMLLLLPEVFTLDGKPHADWQQFIGRFHPLAVHLPIGLIVLLPLLEFAGTYRPALREAASFVLTLGCIACLCTVILGYLLAYGSGDSGLTVTRHMWGAIALTIGLFLSVLARPLWSNGAAPRIYPVLLICVLTTLLFTAHQGGSLTHGSNYLTEYLPSPLKRLLVFNNVAASFPNPDSFYATRIHPIFDANCVACHGAGKSQGGLRLDTYAQLMKGGKDGPVVLARNADRSMLLERVTLPPTNQHFMPAEGRPPLKPDQIALVRAWIQQGASNSAINVAGISAPAQQKEPPIRPVDDYSKLLPDIQRLQQSQGAKLLPVSSKPSDGLVLNTTDVGAGFDDAQLAQFQKFAPYIVEAELGRTSVTDASFDTLTSFTHLRALHLEATAITGNNLGKLVPLTQLTYLNLSQTKVTQSALAPVKAMPNLRHIYLFDTPAQPVATNDAPQSAARSTP